MPHLRQVADPAQFSCRGRLDPRSECKKKNAIVGERKKRHMEREREREKSGEGAHLVFFLCVLQI